MKKILILAMAGLVAWSCDNKDKYELEIPMAGIMLSSPAESQLIDLNDTVDNYEFTWKEASAEGSVLIFSSSPVLLNPRYVKVSSGTSYMIDVLAADALFSELGLAGGTEETAYWAVKPADNITAAASEIRSIRVMRLISRLLSPADQIAITLDRDKTNTKVTFSWDTQDMDPAAEYSIVFSGKSDLSGETVTFQAGAVNTCALSYEQLQDVVLDYAGHAFKTTAVYWNIKDNASGDYLSRTSMTMSLDPMMRLKDVRGTETEIYPVVRISFQDGSEQYWTAENLRTIKYPDGTDIGSDVIFASGGSLTTDQIHIFGGYYAANPTMMSTLPPAGWRVPTHDECSTLYSAAGAAYSPFGLAALCDPVYFANSYIKAQNHLGAWGLNLVTAGQQQSSDGAVANIGYCYIMASGIDASDLNRGEMFATDGLWQTWNTRVPVRFVYNK